MIDTLKEIILSYGYVKMEYGYKKSTEENAHWITLFGGGEIQMYAYHSQDPSLEKVYDTGVLDIVTAEQLNTIIHLFLKNHG